MTDTELLAKIDQHKLLFTFMLRANQWDALTDGKIAEWLLNFHDLKGQYFGSKILLNSLYYSEVDIIDLLRYGLFDLIYGKEIVKEFSNNQEIFLSSSIQAAKVASKKDRTLFMPLLDKDKPHESSLQIIRHLVQTEIIDSKQTSLHFDKISSTELEQYDTIIIVDDCLGSGEQLLEFWNSTELMNIKDHAASRNIRWYYLVLVGYVRSIENILNHLKGLEVIVCDQLNEEHRVFAKESVGVFWETPEELYEAKQYFLQLQKDRNVPAFGYTELDFAVILHRTIPDWTLPIFWKQTGDWNFLLQRKNSSKSRKWKTFVTLFELIVPSNYLKTYGDST